jgi:hypothetical protein
MGYDLRLDRLLIDSFEGFVAKDFHLAFSVDVSSLVPYINEQE